MQYFARLWCYKKKKCIIHEKNKKKYSFKKKWQSNKEINVTFKDWKVFSCKTYMIALFTTVLVHPNISASTKSVIQDMF